MKKTILHMTTAVALISSGASSAYADNIIGRILGGLIGGALCDALEIGQGSGRTAAIALCAVGGSMIGADIQEQMNRHDLEAYEVAQRESFSGEINRPYEWDGRRYGSRSGVRGRMTPTAYGYHRRTSEECRTYISESFYGNRSSRKESIVCRRSDGSFYSLDRKDDFVNGRLVQSETHERQGNVGSDKRRGRDSQPNRGRPEVPPPVSICSGWNPQNLYVGALVYDRRGESANYQGYNSSNNTVAVLNRYGHFETLPIGEIAIQGCHYGYSSGQTVQTRRGTGTILGIYRTGDLVVQVGRWSYIFTQSEIYR